MVVITTLFTTIGLEELAYLMIHCALRSWKLRKRPRGSFLVLARGNGAQVLDVPMAQNSGDRDGAVVPGARSIQVAPEPVRMSRKWMLKRFNIRIWHLDGWQQDTENVFRLAFLEEHPEHPFYILLIVILDEKSLEHGDLSTYQN